METAQLIALLAFLVVAILVALVALRTGSLLRRTREAESFRGDVGDLARRVETSLGDVSAVIDRVRRRDAEADTMAASLAAARDAVDRYAEEARALTGPTIAAVHRDAMIHELERAGRALELVAYGTSMFGTGRRMERGIEAETAIKRGYLNLIHARESIAEHAKLAVEQAEQASPARRFQRRNA
ncbi:MAG: hypothetical protein HYX57_05395 [Chloroflexi bacterium]|nr:hypothetical protein [Chloroflexota bacterium]